MPALMPQLPLPDDFAKSGRHTHTLSLSIHNSRTINFVYIFSTLYVQI